MSIVGGVSGSSSNLYQYLQSLNSPTGPTAPQTVGAADSDEDSNGSGATTATTNTANSPSPSSSSNTGTPSLIQQLQTAIQDALNGVNSSQSSNPQAVLSSVEQAVQTTLQQNGINPSQLSQSGHHHHHGGHGGGSGGSGGGLLAALGASGGSSSTGSDTSTSGNPAGTSQTPGLDSLLSQLNVDPQQFRDDIAAALSGSQNGSLNQSQIFQNFPAGQNVNSLA